MDREASSNGRIVAKLRYPRGIYVSKFGWLLLIRLQIAMKGAAAATESIWKKKKMWRGKR